MLLTQIFLAPLIGILCLLANSQSLAAADFALHYVPNEEFSAMSRRGNPQDINRGGGKRGCLSLAKANDQEYLRALVPVAGGGGLSGVDRPTFWVYSPYVAAAPLPGILALRRAGNFKDLPLQKVAVTLPKQPGWVGLSLPLAIKEHNLLTWSLTVVCDQVNGSRNLFVEGLVLVRPNASLSQQMAGLSAEKRVQGFARSGYWYDALAAATKESLRQQLIEAMQ